MARSCGSEEARLWFWLLALRVDSPGLHTLAWLAGIDELTGSTYTLEARVEQAPSLEEVRKRDLHCGDRVLVTTRNSLYCECSIPDPANAVLFSPLSDEKKHESSQPGESQTAVQKRRGPQSNLDSLLPAAWR